MEALPWFWIWVVVAAVFFVGEMLTTSFFLLPFGLGAALAAIIHVLGLPLWTQWVVFIVVSVVAFILLRPFAKRITFKEPQRSGVDRLIGEVGVVIEVTPQTGVARARVEREEWNIITENGCLPEMGSAIEVIGVDGTNLVVRSTHAKSTECAL